MKKSVSYRISAPLDGGQERLRVKNLLSRFQCVIQLLRNVSFTDKGARATTARELLSQLNSEFLHLLYFFENILTKVNKVSEQKGTNIDLGAACKLICALKDDLS